MILLAPDQPGLGLGDAGCPVLFMLQPDLLFLLSRLVQQPGWHVIPYICIWSRQASENWDIAAPHAWQCYCQCAVHAEEKLEARCTQSSQLPKWLIKQVPSVYNTLKASDQ